jgi:hypothetical protein
MRGCGDLRDPQPWLAVESNCYKVLAAAVICAMLAAVGFIAFGVGALALWGIFRAGANHQIEDWQDEDY